MVHYHPPLKKARVEQEADAAAEAEKTNEALTNFGFGDSAIIRFYDGEGKEVGDEFSLPLSMKREELLDLLKQNLTTEDEKAEEYSLVLRESSVEILESLGKALVDSTDRNAVGLTRSCNKLSISTENTIGISFFSTAPFRVRPVSRLVSSLGGQDGPIICCAFSPDGSVLATGSGDCSVRLWDLLTSTPLVTLKGHTRPVECLCWSPCGRFLATGSEDKTVRVWRYDTMKPVFSAPTPKSKSNSKSNSKTESGKASTPGSLDLCECKVLSNQHRDRVTSLCFMAAHLHDYWQNEAPILVSGAKDGSVRTWNAVTGQCISRMDGHTGMITSVAWSGLTVGRFGAENKMEEGPFVYSASRDMTVRVWKFQTGELLRNVKSHGHWINHLTLNSSGIMRCGPYDPRHPHPIRDLNQVFEIADRNWNATKKNLGQERVVTCSDDSSLALWNLLESDKQLAVMRGHQKAVTAAAFSPNGRFIASGGFDSAIRLWDGRTGKFLHTYRGHVGPVYQLSWALDSRTFVSGSRDTTLKLWDSRTFKLVEDLPGHADEVYAVDWSPTGRHVASGGKDKMLRIWAH